MAVEGIQYKGNPALTTSTKADTTSNSKLEMEDFLDLMVAQMENQDMYNTVDSSEYMAQLAQFSMIESLNAMVASLENLNEVGLASYSASMIGKEAIISTTDAKGEPKTVKGTIQGVTYYEGANYVIVNDEKYPITNVATLYEAGTE